MKELKTTEHNHQKVVGIHHGSPHLLTVHQNTLSENYSHFHYINKTNTHTKIQNANLEHHEVLIKHLKPTLHIVVVVDLFLKKNIYIIIGKKRRGGAQLFDYSFAFYSAKQYKHIKKYFICYSIPD